MDDYIQLRTLIQREVLRYVRRPYNTFLPPIITNTLYFSVFGVILGSRIGSIAGVSYIQFVLPGLVVLGSISDAFYTGEERYVKSESDIDAPESVDAAELRRQNVGSRDRSRESDPPTDSSPDVAVDGSIPDAEPAPTDDESAGHDPWVPVGGNHNCAAHRSFAAQG